MAIHWMLHEGKKILHCDYRGLSHDLALFQLEKSISLLARCDEGVLLLSTFGDDEVDHQFVRSLHQLGRALARGAASKIALVGVGSLKFVIREAYAPLTETDPVYFESEQEALEWLVSMTDVS